MHTSRSLSATSVLRSPGWWQWTIAVGLARLPIAMVPVAFVLTGYVATGSFANGALLASVHALSETLLAPWFGHRLDRQEARSGIQRTLLVQAISLVAFAGMVSLHAPMILLVLAAVVVGGLPSGLSGGFRAFLPHILSPDCLEAGFSLDATLLEIEWLLAPLKELFEAYSSGARGYLLESSPVELIRMTLRLEEKMFLLDPMLTPGSSTVLIRMHYLWQPIKH